MTCAEAVSCGTKVIGFRCGAPESVFPEEYAKFVEYGDILSLKEILLSDSGVSEEHTGKDNYSIHKMSMRYLNIYRGL